MKRLTEREIQERLYGSYRGKPPASPPPQTKPQTPPQPPERRLELGLEPKSEQKEKPSPKKEKRQRKESPLPQVKRPPQPVSPGASQPLGSKPTKFFVTALLGGGLILLAFSLRSKSSSNPPLSTVPAPVVSSPQTIRQKTFEPRRFAIQTIVYAKRDQAERFVEDLKTKNIQAFLEEEATQRGQMRYVVLVGDFPTAGEAAKFLEQLTLRHPKLFQGSFVRKR